MRTLQRALKASEPHQREQLARVWSLGEQTSGGECTGNFALLFRRMQQPAAARRLWERLEDGTRRVLYHALSPAGRQGIRLDLLRQACGLEPAAFDAALLVLTGSLLLRESCATAAPGTSVGEEGAVVSAFYECAHILYETGRELFVPGADRSSWSLEKLLKTLPYSALWRIVQQHQLSLSTFTSAGMRRGVAAELADPGVLLEALKGLNSPLCDLVLWLRDRGGKAPMQEVQRYLDCDDAALFTTLETLCGHALAFDTLSPEEGWLLFAPVTLSERLRGLTLPSPADEGLIPMAAAPAAILPADTLTLYDLAVVVWAGYQLVIEPTQENRIPKRIAHQLQPLLHGGLLSGAPGGDGYLDLLLRAALRLDLLRCARPTVEGLKAHIEPGSGLPTWAALDGVEQVRRFVGWWLQCSLWRDGCGSRFQQWDLYSWRPLEARALLLRYLRLCEPGAWYSVEGLLSAIWEQDPLALRQGLGAFAQRGRSDREMRANWWRCEGEVYRGIVCSTLYELGMLALGALAPASPAELTPGACNAFQVTELGSAVLRGAAAEPPSPALLSHCPQSQKRSLVVQPTMDVYLLAPDLATLYAILPMAHLEQVGKVSHLRLTQGALLRGLGSGVRIEQAMALLEERGRGIVPQNVAYTLREWARGYIEIQIAPVLLLQAASEVAADALCRSTKFRGFGLRKIAPGVLVAHSQSNLLELRRLLGQEGVMVRFGAFPALEGECGARAEGADTS